MLTESNHCASSTSTTPDPQSWTLGGHGGVNGNSQWTRCGMDRTTKSACATDQTITSSQSQQPVCHISFTRKPDHRIIRGYLTECSAHVRCDQYQLDCGLVYVFVQTLTPASAKMTSTGKSVLSAFCCYTYMRCRDGHATMSPSVSDRDASLHLCQHRPQLRWHIMSCHVSLRE